MSQLYQSDTWTSADKVTRPITEMTEKHLRNTIRFIERVGPRLLENCILFYIHGPKPSGEMAQDCFDQEFDWLLDTSPGEFVDRLPIVEAMREQLRRIAVGEPREDPDETVDGLRSNVFFHEDGEIR